MVPAFPEAASAGDAAASHRAASDIEGSMECGVVLLVGGENGNKTVDMSITRDLVAEKSSSKTAPPAGERRRETGKAVQRTRETVRRVTAVRVVTQPHIWP